MAMASYARFMRHLQHLVRSRGKYAAGSDGLYEWRTPLGIGSCVAGQDKKRRKFLARCDHFREKVVMTPLRSALWDDLRLPNKSPRTMRPMCCGSPVRQALRADHRGTRSGTNCAPISNTSGAASVVEHVQSIVCALRILYNVTLGRPHVIVHLPFAKRPRTCRRCSVPKEVVRFLDAALQAGTARSWTWPTRADCAAARQGCARDSRMSRRQSRPSGNPCTADGSGLRRRAWRTCRVRHRLS